MLQCKVETKIPRLLIELGFRLLDEYFAVCDRYTDDLISRDTWERALAKVGKSF